MRVTRPSRAIASGRRSGGRSDRVGLLWSAGRPLAGCSGGAGHQLPARAAAIRDRGSTRLAYALPNYVPSASSSSTFSSLYRGRAKGRGLEPTCGQSDLGRVHRAGRVTPTEVRHRPRSQKPVTPASRLAAQIAPSAASGLGLRILAAGPARVGPYSDCGRYVNQTSKVCSGSSATPRDRRGESGYPPTGY
jgi:hypothetical protein